MRSNAAKILVTGIEGFTGGHMLDLLSTGQNPPDIIGVHKNPLTTLPDVRSPELVKCDVTNNEAIARVIREMAPDVVYHFAGLVSVAQSFKFPLEYLKVNVEGTMNVLEAVRKSKIDAKVLVPGSSETYGVVDSESLPIEEDIPQRPNSPYGLSKLLQERVCRYYHDAMGMRVYITRTFHSVGPRQGTGFVCSDFAKQVTEAEKVATRTVIKVGNLSAKRDFLDIRDLVKAYKAITEKGREGTPYNVCSGRSVSIKHVLDTLISLSNARVTVNVDTEKLRPLDVPEFLGDNSRLRSDTSWSPSIPLERTLEDILIWWRTQSG